MGRARFLLYMGFFLTARPWAERGSCFARDLLLFLTARPWAERGSCFTRDLLTARPWAERGSCFTRDFFFFNRAAMGRARFLLYTGFIIIIFFYVGDQTQTSTRPNRHRD